MDSTLLVIGTNHRTCQVEVRERFWVGDARLLDVLHELAAAPGVDEVVILSTCNRTEFILWAADPDLASAAVRGYLVREHQLSLEEWRSFYRHTGDAALAHIFRVTSSLDSMVVGEPQITGQVKTAWTRAQQAGVTGRFLDAAFQKALSVAKRVRNETSIGAAAVSIPYAAVELARRIFGNLAGRKVLLLGAGKMSELSARYMVNHGVSAVWVASRTLASAESIAKELGGEAVRFEDRWRHLAEADIVISSTGCPHAILTREDAQRIHAERHGRPVFFIDIAVPRDIDPGVREVPGCFLYDIDDLERVMEHNRSERQAAAATAEQLVIEEARRFAHKLRAERMVPTIVALRGRVEEIFQQELQSYRTKYGPLSEAEEKLLQNLTAHLTERLASQLARELKQAAEVPEREQITDAVRRIFGLHRGLPAPAAHRTATS